MNANSTPQPAWYKTWFEEDYLAVYAHRNLASAKQEIDFLIPQLLLSAQHCILDMACGAGRHLHALQAAGISAVGCDLSHTLLLQAKRGIAGTHAPLIEYDMRAFPFKSTTFDFVLNLFTSFGYFKEESENKQVLSEVSRVLKLGGTFFIDYPNASLVIKNLVPHSERQCGDLFIQEQRAYVPDRKRLEKQISIDEGSSKRTYLESMRLYEPQELRELLVSSGLSVTREMGDFNGGAFSPASPRFMLIAKKV